MFYPVRVVSEERLLIPQFPVTDPPVQRFLALIHTASLLFDQAPAVLPSGDERLTLLYRDVVYLLQDVAEATAGLSAALSALWPLRFYGTTEDRETAEWTVSALDSQMALLRLSSLSGQPFDHLEGLGIQMKLPNAALSAALEELCAPAPFLRPCAVIPARGAALLKGSPMLAPARGSRFSYLSWEPLSSGQLLCALTAEHKATLWKDLLADGIQASEFDWLWAQYYTGEPLFLLEWELALHLALEELGFRVEREAQVFRVLDGTGRERQFDFARGGPAEKVFLKLLFPLDTK